jgi:hypothetical protein
MGRKNNAYSDLRKNAGEADGLEDQMYNTRIYLEVIGWKWMRCFYLLQDKDYLLDLGKTIVNLVGP